MPLSARRSATKRVESRPDQINRLMLRLTALLFPLMILAMILKQERPILIFLKAGAISPETARKPASLAIEKLYLLEGPVKRSVLIALRDGRYYVDTDRHRRVRRRMIALLIVITMVIFACVLMFWPGGSSEF